MDRLFVAVLGQRNSGKSTTWNELFGHDVRTGKASRWLDLGNSRRVEVFLISGSHEERGLYAGDVLNNVDCRIVLCSVQYAASSIDTWNYVFENEFAIYTQWLNPGYAASETWDSLGLVNLLLGHGAALTIRDGQRGQARLSARVEDIRQFISGWANARRLDLPI